jgi:hypothetical protein
MLCALPINSPLAVVMGVLPVGLQHLLLQGPYWKDTFYFGLEGRFGSSSKHALA